MIGVAAGAGRGATRAAAGRSPAIGSTAVLIRTSR